ncbi:MAG: hypothetical protein HYX47_13295 [Burkholderiales bacterium]|nr:hypothetical protein [Burkholderiales bacterium]
MKPVMTRRILLALAMLAAVAPAFAVYCPRILFDPDNFVKNTIMAEQGVEATAARAASMLTRMQQFQTQVAQLRSIDSVVPRAAEDRSATQLADMRLLLATLRQMQGSVQQVRSRMGARLDEVKAMGMSWDKYILYEQQRIEKNVKIATARATEEARALDQVGKDFTSYQEVAARIPESAGMHEAMQKLNVQANQMIVQSAQMARLLAPTAASAGSVTEIRQQRNERATRQLQQMEQLHELSRSRQAGERRAIDNAGPNPRDQ